MRRGAGAGAIRTGVLGSLDVTVRLQAARSVLQCRALRAEEQQYLQMEQLRMDKAAQEASVSMLTQLMQLMTGTTGTRCTD